MAAILYQNGAYTVRPETFGRTHGYAVYREGTIVAERVASIGYAADHGLRLAITEADKRAREAA